MVFAQMSALIYGFIQVSALTCFRKVETRLRSISPCVLGKHRDAVVLCPMHTATVEWRSISTAAPRGVRCFIIPLTALRQRARRAELHVYLWITSPGLLREGSKPMRAGTWLPTYWLA